jgi:hypothetical protein
MNLLHAARWLAGLVTVSVLAGQVPADARSCSSGRTLGNSITVIGKTPQLDRQMLAGLDFMNAGRVHPISAVAQKSAIGDNVVRAIEAKGFSKITGLTRRGENYVFQALDASGIRVRVVMDRETGEIVGLSRVMPKKN